MNERLRAWIIAGRFFAAPWCVANALLGVSLAGFNFPAWILGSLITIFVLTGAHHLNNVRDFVRGVDRIESGSKKKAYTGAQQILPSGILSAKTEYASTLGFFILGTVLLLLFAPLRPDVVLFFLIGLFFACTYHDVFKPMGFPEIALFGGHGVAITVFAYSLVAPVNLTAISAGVLLGIWAAFGATLDQYKDVATDLSKRIRNLAWVLAETNIPISQYCTGVLAMIYSMQMGFVLMGFLPPMTLLTVLLLPLAHFSSIMIEKNFNKGIILVLLSMWMFPVLMSAGVLL